MNKGLVTRLGETIDQHRQEHQAQVSQPAEPTNRSRLPGIVRWFLPNGGTLLLIAILIFSQNVWAGSVLRNLTAESAASTGTIAYQGRLADSSGNPLTSTLNMSFRLYSAVTGGAPLWSEQWTGPNGVKVSDGLFNVMLGSLTPIAQSVITGNSNLFLGITVGTDDEMAPRVQLGSVPFAVQALTVPDGSITTAKIADGAVTQTKAPSLIQSVGGTNLKVQFGLRTAIQPPCACRIAFPVAFSDSPLTVVAVADSGGPVQLWVRDINSTGFSVEISGYTSPSVNWVAIGP